MEVLKATLSKCRNDLARSEEESIVADAAEATATARVAAMEAEIGSLKNSLQAFGETVKEESQNKIMQAQVERIDAHMHALRRLSRCSIIRAFSLPLPDK